MIYAVGVLDPTIATIFYGVAVVFFVIAAIGYTVGKVSFVAAGLAAFAFPFFWNTLATV